MSRPLDIQHQTLVQLLLQADQHLVIAWPHAPRRSRCPGSQRVTMFGLPSGALSAPHSPLASVLVRSQSGLKFRLQSIQSRLALLMRVFTGLFAVAVATDSLASSGRS